MITQQYLKEILHYDPVTGVFTWLKPVSNRVRIGERAGTESIKGYWSIQINRKKYKLHILAWLYFYGEWPKGEIDHKNRIKSDNRITNLRDGTRTANMANRYMRANNTSGYTGVVFHEAKGKWQAQMYYDGKNHHLGYFDSKVEAAVAYNTRFREINADMEEFQ